MPKLLEGKLGRGERIDNLLKTCGMKVRAKPGSVHLSKRELSCIESFIKMLRKRERYG